MRSSRSRTPLTIFGTPRCFSPNSSRMTASRKKAMRCREQHRALFARLRLMTVRNRNFSTSAPTIASVTPEATSASDERQASRP